MWLFTKYGFYSAVCARAGDGSHGQPVDPDRIMVRARIRSHLEALRDRFSDLLADCEIKEFAGTDYAYRIFVDKTMWSALTVTEEAKVQAPCAIAWSRGSCTTESTQTAES